MPFPLTHLMVGYEILQNTPKIKDPYAFLLGNIAPDAVHHRADFNRELKSISHLCVGEEPWGMVTKNEWWLNNVMTFLRDHVDHSNKDFIYGYCAHIMSDIQNNIKIWIPFRTENTFTVYKGLSSKYHEESSKIDKHLFDTETRKAIWQILKDTTSIDCENMPGVQKQDVNQIRDHLLYQQYKDKDRERISDNIYVTMEITETFIKETSQYVQSILFE